MLRIMDLWRLSLCVVVAATALSAAGCGKSNPGKGVPVSGIVTVDGKPLADADVHFMNDTFIGYGRTNAEGKYRLVQGAAPGTNKVAISKVEGGATPVEAAAAAGLTDSEGGLDSGQFEAAAMGAAGTKRMKVPKNAVPPEYSDPATTKLTFEVPSDGSQGVDFNL
jgi:hypothetical protein